MLVYCFRKKTSQLICLLKNLNSPYVYTDLYLRCLVRLCSITLRHLSCLGLKMKVIGTPALIGIFAEMRCCLYSPRAGLAIDLVGPKVVSCWERQMS